MREEVHGLEPQKRTRWPVGRSWQEGGRQRGTKASVPLGRDRKKTGPGRETRRHQAGQASAIQLLLDGDAQGADAQRLGGPVPPRAAQVEVGPYLPEAGVEGVQVAVALRVVEGQLTLLALQLHAQAARDGGDQGRCGGVRGHAVVAVHALCAAHVPEARARVVVAAVRVALGARVLARPHHAHAPARQCPQVHLPGM